MATPIEDSSMVMGDVVLDRVVRKQSKNAGRKRRVLVFVSIIVISFVVAFVAAYRSDFSWRFFSASDEEFDNGSGIVDTNENGAGDELINENSGIELPEKNNKPLSGKEAFKDWKKNHQGPKPGTISHVNHDDPKEKGAKGGRNKKPNIWNQQNNNPENGNNKKPNNWTPQNNHPNNEKKTRPAPHSNYNSQPDSTISTIDEISFWTPDGPNYQILEILPHDETSFTQGLTYHDGKLYETTGLNGHSKLRRLNPSTGDVEASIDLSSTYFGEGVCYNAANNTLIQITWKKKTGFVYDIDSFDLIKTFTFSTTADQGWGITQNPTTNELIVSDGSQYLHFWDPETLEEIRRVEVKRTNGHIVQRLNELEFVNGRVFSNIWFSDEIVSIDPVTGLVKESYDFSDIWPKSERNPGADVLNGISITDIPNELFVTGKKWSKLFRVRINLPLV